MLESVAGSNEDSDPLLAAGAYRTAAALGLKDSKALIGSAWRDLESAVTLPDWAPTGRLLAVNAFGYLRRSISSEDAAAANRLRSAAARVRERDESVGTVLEASLRPNDP
jgi:hypothetical protein